MYVPRDRRITPEEAQELIEAMGVEVVPKNTSTLMHAIGLFLWVISFTWVFGGNFKKEFMTRYWTTVGKKVCPPSSVADPFAFKYIRTLHHELIHVDQYMERPVWMPFSYLFVPIFIFFAWFRWRWEREAYLVGLLHYTANVRVREQQMERIVQSLWSAYVFAWPRWLMRRWFLKRFSEHDVG